MATGILAGMFFYDQFIENEAFDVLVFIILICSFGGVISIRANRKKMKRELKSRELTKNAGTRPDFKS